MPEEHNQSQLHDSVVRAALKEGCGFAILDPLQEYEGTLSYQ